MECGICCKRGKNYVPRIKIKIIIFFIKIEKMSIHSINISHNFNAKNNILKKTLKKKLLTLKFNIILYIFLNYLTTYSQRNIETIWKEEHRYMHVKHENYPVSHQLELNKNLN